MPTTSAPRSGTRSLIRPAASDTTNATTASGASHSPTSTGDPRRTSSMNSDRYTKAPNEPADSDATMTVAPRNVRLRNSARSSIGASLRSSTATKAARKAEPRRDEPEHGRARPPERVAAQDREDDQEQPGRERRHAGPVDRLGIGVARLADLAHREHDGRHAEHDAEHEDRLPAERLDEQAADERAGGERQPDGRAPDPDRPPALGALELLGEQRQRAREDDRGAQPLHGPRARSASPPTAPARTAPRRTVNRHSPPTNSRLRPNRSASEPAVSWKTASTSA